MKFFPSGPSAPSAVALWLATLALGGLSSVQVDAFHAGALVLGSGRGGVQRSCSSNRISSRANFPVQSPRPSSPLCMSEGDDSEKAEPQTPAIPENSVSVEGGAEANIVEEEAEVKESTPVATTKPVASPAKAAAPEAKVSAVNDYIQSLNPFQYIEVVGGEEKSVAAPKPSTPAAPKPVAAQPKPVESTPVPTPVEAPAPVAEEVKPVEEAPVAPPVAGEEEKQQEDKEKQQEDKEEEEKEEMSERPVAAKAPTVPVKKVTPPSKPAGASVAPRKPPTLEVVRPAPGGTPKAATATVADEPATESVSSKAVASFFSKRGPKAVRDPSLDPKVDPYEEWEALLKSEGEKAAPASSAGKVEAKKAQSSPAPAPISDIFASFSGLMSGSQPKAEDSKVAPAKSDPAPPKVSAPAPAPAQATKAPPKTAAPSPAFSLKNAFMSSFAPDPALAPKKKEVAAPAKPMTSAPAPAPEKKAVAAAPSAAAPSFFGSLFAPQEKEVKESAPAASRPVADKKAVATKTASVPAPAPAPAPLAPKEPSPSLFGSMFAPAVFDTESDVPKPRSAPVAARKVEPVAPPAPAAKAPQAENILSSFFGAAGAKPSSQPKSKVAAPPTQDPAPVPAPAKAPQGLFGGLLKASPAPAPVSQPAPAPEPEKKVPAPAAFGGLFSFGKPAAKEQAAPAAPPKVIAAKPPAVKAKPARSAPARAPVANAVKKAPTPSPASGGLFSFLGGGSPAAPSAAPQAKATAASAQANRERKMDDSFLRTVSSLIGRDSVRAKKFQQQTDRFRGGLLGAKPYYDSLTDIFGKGNVATVIEPLLSSLPEKDKAKALSDIYQREMAKAAPQPARKAPAASAPLKAPAAAKSGGLFGGFNFGAAPVPSSLAQISAASSTDPYSFASGQLSPSDFDLFKKRAELYARGGINARNFYDFIERAASTPRAKDAIVAGTIKALPPNKAKLLQQVYDGLNK